MDDSIPHRGEAQFAQNLIGLLHLSEAGYAQVGQHRFDISEELFLDDIGETQALIEALRHILQTLV